MGIVADPPFVLMSHMGEKVSGFQREALMMDDSCAPVGLSLNEEIFVSIKVDARGDLGAIVAKSEDLKNEKLGKRLLKLNPALGVAFLIASITNGLIRRLHVFGLKRMIQQLV